MSDTTLRHITMLSMIPAAPRRIAARELHRKLKAERLDVHIRSIERDLHKLSRVFPLRSDNAHPAGWSWVRSGTKLSFPGMSPAAALTWELVARYLRPVLPPGLYKQLEPEFAQAEQTLHTLQASRVAQWSKHVAVLPNGHQLLPPGVPDAVRDVVYEAVLQQKQLTVHYQSMDDDKPIRRRLHAIGLVMRDNSLYLVATMDEYEDIRLYALHRMHKPQLMQEAAVAPEGFDFQRYIQTGDAFAIHWGRDIALEMRVDDWLARHLSERRLSEDQQIRPIRGKQGQGRMTVTATVPGSDQLFWWLRSFGSSVEVRKPAALRKWLLEDARATVKRYGR